jgi:sensor histidine kinase YesM
VVSVVREIKDYSIVGGAKYGYVELQQPLSRIGDFLVNLDGSIASFIVDDTGAGMFGAAPDTALQDMLHGKTNGVYEQDGNFIAVKALRQAPYSVMLIQPVKAVTFAISLFLALLCIAAVLVATLAVFSDYLIIRKLTRPLQALRESVAAVSLDNLALDLDDDGDEVSDEFTHLNHAFQKMFAHLRESINKLVASKTSEAHTYLLALQAQLNPHFLHNTLSLISVMTRDGENKKVIEVCKRLSDMLRFTANYQDSACTLADELEHTRNFLQLMKYRYEERFSFEIKTEPAALTRRIPKLLLQPLVENSFKHGFKDKSPPWYISIAISVKDNYWFVETTDNGSGFSDEYRRDFQTFQREITTENTLEKIRQFSLTRMFIENTYIRLKLFYGGDMIFELSNIAGGGAKIIIGGRIDDKSAGC